MRELHVVAVSEDGRHLVLGPAAAEQDAAPSARAGQGTHRLPIDARLAAALRGELSKRPARSERADAHGRTASQEPSLTVREIQSRLRAGESPEQIAASSSVTVEHVRRFAGPVFSEREKIIERARATPLEHGRRGQSALPLGEVVEMQFAAMQGVRPDTVTWSTRREEAGTWLVEVTYTSRARARTGAWRFDPKARTLVAADTVSAALGHSDNIEGTAAALPVGSLTPATTSRSAVAKPASPRRTARPAASRSADKPAAAPKAPPAAEPARRRTRAASGSGVAGTVPPPAPASPAPVGPPTLRVVPASEPPEPVPDRADPPAPPHDEPAAKDGPPAKRPARGRVSVPGWADVLLSTAPVRQADEAAD